jgi:hypothetical protein
VVLGSRLNCGPGATISRIQCRKLLHDAGLMGGEPPFLDADFDIVYSNVLSHAPTASARLNYDQFYFLLGQVALRRFPNFSEKVCLLASVERGDLV